MVKIGITRGTFEKPYNSNTFVICSSNATPLPPDRTWKWLNLKKKGWFLEREREVIKKNPDSNTIAWIFSWLDTTNKNVYLFKNLKTHGGVLRQVGQKATPSTIQLKRLF